LLYLTGADAPGWRRAARCVRNTLWVLRTPSAGQHARRARPLAAAEVTASAIPWPAPKYGTAVLERSALGMRYWLQCPATPMELCAVEHGSEVEGYFVLAFAPGQARLADCWLESAEPAAWEALVQLAVRQAARHSDVAELVAIRRRTRALWLSRARLTAAAGADQQRRAAAVDGHSRTDAR